MKTYQKAILSLFLIAVVFVLCFLVWERNSAEIVDWSCERMYQSAKGCYFNWEVKVKNTSSQAKLITVEVSFYKGGKLLTSHEETFPNCIPSHTINTMEFNLNYDCNEFEPEYTKIQISDISNP